MNPPRVHLPRQPQDPNPILESLVRRPSPRLTPTLWNYSPVRPLLLVLKLLSVLETNLNVLLCTLSLQRAFLRDSVLLIPRGDGGKFLLVFVPGP